jgi:predicted phage terminase large subunit-like protein
MARIKISTKQRLFLSSLKRYVVYRGGIGSGKTRILCYKAIINALNGRKCLVVANTFPQLRDVVLATFIEVLQLFDIQEDKDYVINKSDMDIIIRGTYIHLRSAEQDEKLRGINCHDVFIDEARNIKDDKLFLILIGRMRNTSDGQCFICSTPRGRDWVWKLSESLDCDLITQRTEENPFLSDVYKEDLRKRYTSQFAAQELDAEIVEFSAGVLKRSWFRKVASFQPTKLVRAWDIAVSVKTSSDYSAGALLGYNGRFCLMDMKHGKYTYPDLRQLIIDTALLDGRHVVVAIEHVGTQLGFIQDLQMDKSLLSYNVRAIKVRSDKLARVTTWASRAEQGLFDIVEAPWNDAFFDEIDSFSADMSHTHDDQCDAVSLGYTHLAEPVGSAAKVKLY